MADDGDKRRGLAARYCPCCNTRVQGAFKPGPAGRPDASCPNCRSLERQRFLALLLAWLRPTLGPIGTVLDIAPSDQVTPLLARLQSENYVRLDLGADNRLVDVVGSLTELPLPTDSVDLLVCYHVLEHVPDDHAAMREIARVLRPGAIALLQVPWRPRTTTDEDPSAPVEVRIERFGQADHVRYYGIDFEQRLLDAGLTVRRVTPRVLLGDALCALFRVLPTETVWIASSSSDPFLFTVDSEQTSSLTSAFGVAMELLAAETERADHAERRVRTLRRRVKTLQGREGVVYKLGRRLPEGLRERSRGLASGRFAQRLRK